MDQARLLDPSVDPNQWLWDALQPVVGPLRQATLVDRAPEPLGQALADPSTRTTLVLVLLLLLGLRAPRLRLRALPLLLPRAAGLHLQQDLEVVGG
jgi:hypothetical protein